MKKLFFLLVAFLVGFGVVFAAGMNPAEPPGVFDTTATSLMAEFGIHEGIVTQPVVLAQDMPVTVDPSSFQAVMVQSTITTNSGTFSVISMPTNTGQTWTVGNAADYHLRC